MKKIYMAEFVGGKYNGMIIDMEELEKIGNGKYIEDCSEIRAKGGLCHGEDLDNKPLVDGYLSPMKDGIRLVVDGEIKRYFKCSDEDKEKCETVIVMLRYETQEVYDMLSV